MKKKSSTARRLLGNFKRLVPFIGFLLVITGILGLIFVQKPLEESQDVRSDASEPKYEVFLPSIQPTDKNQKVYLNEETTISLDLNTIDGVDLKKVNLVFNIINDNIDAPLIVVNAGSGLRAELIEVEKTTDGYLVHLKAVPNDIVWETPPVDTSFVKITFKATNQGKISFNFDPNNTFMESSDTAFSIDAQTINYDIEVRTISCAKDTFRCEDGTLVGRVAPSCNFAACPNTDVPDTEIPEIKQCNESCDTNANCQVGYRCFNTGSEKKCRLATNPSSSDCSQLSNQSCNQYCAKSSNCKEGLSCWNNKCRNPQNVDSTSCANLSTTQQTEIVKSCGQECSTNADCGINLRCYNNVCRLVSNPSSLSCTPLTNKTVSKIYDQDAKAETLLPKVAAKPVKKGDNIIPNDLNQDELQKLKDNNQEVNPSKRIEIDGDDDVPVDETALDLLLKMIKDKQQGMPTAIILIGILLLVASLITFLIAKIINSRSKSNKSKLPELDTRTINVKSHDIEPAETPNVNPKSSLKTELPTNTPETTLKSTQNVKVKELLEKINQQSNKQN